MPRGAQAASSVHLVCMLSNVKQASAPSQKGRMVIPWGLQELVNQASPPKILCVHAELGDAAASRVLVLLAPVHPSSIKKDHIRTLVPQGRKAPSRK